MRADEFITNWFRSIPSGWFSVCNQKDYSQQFWTRLGHIHNYDMVRINHSDWQNALVVDMDEEFGALGWEDHGIRPNLAMTNPRNGHAHLVWCLRTPIWRRNWGKPAQFADDIQKRLTSASHGDESYAAAFVKNPLSTTWNTTIFTDHLYDLNEFTSLPYVSKRPRIQTGTGRNNDLFATIKHLAYQHRDEFRGANKKEVIAALLPEAKQIAEKIRDDYHLQDEPFSDREVVQVVRSVSNYAVKGKLFGRGHRTLNPGIMNLPPGPDNRRLGAEYTARGKTEQTREAIRMFRLDHPHASQLDVARAVGRSVRRVRDFWKITSPKIKVEVPVRIKKAPASLYIPVGLIAGPHMEMTSSPRDIPLDFLAGNFNWFLDTS